MPISAATSSHTSGWSWYGGISSSLEELVEREQHDEVDADGEEQAADEQPAEQAAVGLQVHEVPGDHAELYRHHRHQEQQQQGAVVLERLDEVRRRLHRRE